MTRGRKVYTTTAHADSPVKAAVEAARIRAGISTQAIAEALYVNAGSLIRMLCNPDRMTEFDRNTIKKILPLTEEELAVLDAAEIEG